MFAANGLVVVGMYTPKPRPRAVTLDEVRGYVKAYGFTFPVAIDADWAALHELWLDRLAEAKFTSATLLIDRTVTFGRRLSRLPERHSAGTGPPIGTCSSPLSISLRKRAPTHFSISTAIEK